MPDKRLIVTGDGTLSLFCDEYGEAMHSISGAYEESLLKHVYPSKITGIKTSPVCVLDIGFGLGYNILALMAEINRTSPGPFLNVISLEKDTTNREYLGSIRFNDYRDEYYKIIQMAYKAGYFSTENMDIKILFADARQSVIKLEGLKFNAIFHDPFSPSKNPELWSLDFFRQLHRLTAEDGILTTYSSAPQIRSALVKAGFVIGRGPSVGKKREGTIACRGVIIEPIPSDEIDCLLSNKKSAPYRDPDLNAAKEKILKRRKEEMKK